MAIVYNHIRLDNNEIFYVGIGTDIKRAYIKHNRSNLWNKIIKKYGYYVKITHKDIIWEEACAIEKYLISFYGRLNLGLGNLCNLTDGGDGILGLKKSDETKKIHRLQALGNKNMLGKKHSIETIEKIRIKNKGKIRSEECRTKMRNFIKNKVSDETKKKISLAVSGKNASWYGKFGSEHNTSKEVEQYTINGDLINIFGSTREAQRITKTSHISCCCNGYRKSANGFIWKYK